MLEGIPLATLGPTGLLLSALIYVFVRVIRGDLVPRATLDDAREDVAHWRAALETAELARAELREQVKELTAQGETTVAMIRSIMERAS